MQHEPTDQRELPLAPTRIVIVLVISVNARDCQRKHARRENKYNSRNGQVPDVPVGMRVKELGQQRKHRLGWHLKRDDH